MFRSIQLPPDDGSIEKALSDLDSKLAAWTEAANKTRAHVTQVPQDVEDNEDKDKAIDRADSGPVIEPNVVSASDTAVESPPSDEPIQVTSKPEDLSLKDDTTLSNPHNPPKDDPPCELPSDVEDEDDKLLESLDDEVVSQIRVLRRLPENKKSVRELLSELEVSKQEIPNPIQKKKGKSWFQIALGR